MRFPAERPTPRKSVLYDRFLSVDFSKASTNLKEYHSPNAVNMIRDEYGKIRRRMGYFKVDSYGAAPVHGFTRHNGSLVVHCGDALYNEDKTVLFSPMAARPPQFYQAGGKLYILDGVNFLVYDGTTCAPVEGKIPKIIIAGSPTGGGTAFEQVNLIQNKWEQSFRGTAGATAYQLAFGDLDATPVTVKKAKLVSGKVEWDALTEGTHFTVNRAAGIVTFGTAPGEPVFAQEDNVSVTASKDRAAQRARITGCCVAKPFGVAGYENQLFVTGNGAHKNQLFWSGVNDPTYWGDLQYALLGQDDSAIQSLNTLSTTLVVHKDTVSANTYICSVFLVKINELDTPQIKVDRVVSGSGCICRYGSQQFGEPVFVTQLGVQAITTRDITAQEIETMRGSRINRRLLQEPGLESAVSCVFKYFYLLAVNGNVYVLDRLNPQEDANALYQNFQYNAFFWNHFPASSFFIEGDTLYFGTPAGDIMRMYADENSSLSYNDDGETYDWLWEFPEYVGERFYSNKSIQYVAIRAKAYIRCALALDIQLQGLWYEVFSDSMAFGYLDLGDLDLNNLNLSTDATPKKKTEKYSERKLDKFAFRIRGNKLNEPFGLYSFAFEVKEKGKHKG